jgi:hypothetical protein
MVFYKSMTASRAAHIMTAALAPLVLIAMLYCLHGAEMRDSAAWYRLSWYLLIGAVLLMEARVRFGYGTPRGALFYAHLAFAVPFFMALTALAFLARPLWLVAAADALLLGLAALGGVLLTRSVRAAMAKPRSS